MMWSNFFIQEEERRRADTVRRRTQRTGLARERRGPIKLALLLSGMGTALAVLAVGTEFWVELGTKRGNGTSGVCEAAHLGLWRVCAKRLWLEDLPPNRETCGPAELPGGVLLLVSLQLFRQGVHALLARTGPTPAPWLGYEYSWSVACALAAAGLLLLGGGSFLLLALPSRTLKMCCRQQPGDQGGGGAT
ncbi:voltage-dependent calcium channel gamma-6 subunit isoform X3 [Gracilinanus agilis]|uniref:voltage-dependent calcium channel gamma-6 subunit isoform X3 n=1 Tax=Gracilinanus agilis TaxID=191870 RepID=UPI001CFD6642|nr:voltage-dependent calcium channel gamma-6 subunit isoform X3 [Gracilinanus agilis]